MLDENNTRIATFVGGPSHNKEMNVPCSSGDQFPPSIRTNIFAGRDNWETDDGEPVFVEYKQGEEGTYYFECFYAFDVTKEDSLYLPPEERVSIW